MTALIVTAISASVASGTTGATIVKTSPAKNDISAGVETVNDPTCAAAAKSRLANETPLLRMSNVVKAVAAV